MIASFVVALTGTVSRAQSPGLYIVQPDDTLESVAENFDNIQQRVIQLFEQALDQRP